MDGYIYCIYNKMYETYGDNVYKLGYCGDVSSLTSRYTTPYIDEYEIKYLKKVKDKVRAEKVLFYLLREYRVRKNREFFDCEIGKIKEQIDKCDIDISIESDISKENQIYKEMLNMVVLDKMEEDNNIEIIDDMTHIYNEETKKWSRDVVYFMKYVQDIMQDDWYNILIKKKKEKWFNDILFEFTRTSKKAVKSGNKNLCLKNVLVSNIIREYEKDDYVTDTLSYNWEEPTKEINEEMYKRLNEISGSNMHNILCFLKREQNKKESIILDGVNNKNKMELIKLIRNVYEDTCVEFYTIKKYNMSKKRGKINIIYCGNEKVSNINDDNESKILIFDGVLNNNKEIPVIRINEKVNISGFNGINNMHKCSFFKMINECEDVYIIIPFGDSIIQWFKDNYERTGMKEDILKVGEIFNDFKISEHYSTLKKDEKRKYNKAYFTDYIKSNVFFAKDYYERYKSNFRNVLAGWKRKETEEVIGDISVLDI